MVMWMDTLKVHPNKDFVSVYIYFNLPQEERNARPLSNQETLKVSIFSHKKCHFKLYIKIKNHWRLDGSVS